MNVWEQTKFWADTRGVSGDFYCEDIWRDVNAVDGRGNHMRTYRIVTVWDDGSFDTEHEINGVKGQVMRHHWNINNPADYECAAKWERVGYSEGRLPPYLKAGV
jgi:hypothetical protein